MNEAASDRPVSIDTAKLIYVLYLVGFAAGITLVIGVVMAYVNQDGAPDWLRTHYRFRSERSGSAFCTAWPASC